MKNLKRILVALIIVSMMAPFVVSAEEVSFEDAAKVLTYEIISDEVHFAITKDLDLAAVAEKIGADVTWKSSDTSVITDDGVVTRDGYRNQSATLTATIGTGSNAITKTFDFTVISNAINTYYSDTFYYPEHEGKLITDASSAWSFTRTTTLDGDGMITKIVKDDTEELNYYTRGGRTGTTEAVHYTAMPFTEKHLGQLTWEADLMFDNDEGTRQLYFIEFYGKYQVGQYVDTLQVADFRIDISADEKVFAYTRYYDGNSIKSKTIPGSYTKEIQEEQWSRLRIDLDTETQTWDIYLNGKPYILDTPFYERDHGIVDSGDFLGITSMQYGPFRTYTSGNAICFDNVSFRDDNRLYDENAAAYEFSDLIDFSLLTDEDIDSVTEELDLSIRSLQDEIEDKNLTVTWTTSDASALNISGNKAIPSRGKTPKEVVLTANIIEDGKTHTVKKNFDITVMPSDEYVKVYNVYRKLTEETFTIQPAGSISSNLDFSDAQVEKFVSLNGVDLEFTSSNEDVISSTGVVTRGDGEKDCEITVTVIDRSTGASMMKSFNYTVMDKSQYVYHSTNFAYPAYEGKELSAKFSSNWNYLYEYSATTKNRMKSTIEKEDDNYLLQTLRGAANTGDTNYNSLSFTRAKGNVSIKMRLKFDHYKDPGMYVFYIYGQYFNGTQNTAMQCGEVRFDYDASRVYIPYYNGTSVKTDSLYTLPKVGEWLDFEFRMNVLTQTWDLYINGEKFNTNAIPFYYANYTKAGSEAMRTCVGINNIRYNTYRYTSDNAIYTDDVVVTGVRNLQSNCEIYENGEKITELKLVNGFEGSTYDVVARVLNDTGVDKNFDLYVAVYDDDKLVSIKKKANLSLKNGASVSETLTGIEIPRNLENAVMKVFMIDQNLVPVEINSTLVSDIMSDYEPETYYFEDTGREMTYIDLHGKIAYKPYFNAQCWSADSRKIYFQGKDHAIYEYNFDTDQIRFIAEGYGNFGIVTTPGNKLFYASKQGRMVEMDCDTYEKRIAGELPPGQTKGGNLLTVSNDGKYLSVMWSDTIGGMENSDKVQNRRFPVLNTETGEWNLDNYFGFADAPPYNTGMNPAYPNLLLFNHCAAKGDTFDRNWVIDTNTGIATNRFVQKPYSNSTTGEVISHETWSYDGELLYIDKAISSKIAMGGVMSFDKDGNNRRHINDDYSYLHLGVNPVNPRFVVSDTGYNATKKSDIVVVDCHSGKSYKLATTNQRGDDSVAHSHPAFSPDGQKVYFGVFNGDYTSAGIGIIDVSDIVNQPDYMEIVDLSDSCNAESYPGESHEIKLIEKDGKSGYSIENGNFMRVNYKGAEQSNVKADIEITYFADGGQGELGYFVWIEDFETHCSLDLHKYTFDKLNTGKWETITVSFDDINLENMGHMGSDFYLKGVDSELSVRSVKVTQK